MRLLNRKPVVASVLAVASLTVAASCKRESRNFRVPPPAAQMSEAVPVNNPMVRPGPRATSTPSTLVPVDVERVMHEPYGSQSTQSAQMQSDGQWLYEAFNCSGCHAHGGGGMGPPLLDKKWFYGDDPASVYASIIGGRPNGMPSYRGRIPDAHIWSLVGYVRSLSGQANPNAASGREEHMSTTVPPNSTPAEKPEKVPQPTTGPATGRTAQ